MTHYWRIRKWLPERFNQRCRVLARGKMNTILVEFEDGFLAHIILPNSQTASEWLRPKIEAAYESGSMPQILALPAPE